MSTRSVEGGRGSTYVPPTPGSTGGTPAPATGTSAPNAPVSGAGAGFTSSDNVDGNTGHVVYTTPNAAVTTGGTVDPNALSGLKGLASSSSGYTSGNTGGAFDAEFPIGAGGTNLPFNLTQNQQGMVNGLVSDARGFATGIQNYFNPGKMEDIAQDILARGGKIVGGDLEALIQWVLRESYMGTCEDLRHFADKVKFFNEQKKAIREHLADCREMSAKGRDFIAEQGPPAWDPEKLTPDQKQQLASYLGSLHMQESGGVMPPAVSGLAYDDSVEAKMVRVDATVHDKFGFSLQERNPELYNKLVEAFQSGDATKVEEALTEFACYLSALADNNTQGRSDGYDDVDDGGNTVGTQAWFEHYMESDVNATARTDLAEGDVALIEEIFEFPPGELSQHGYSVTAVAELAMTFANEKWPREIKEGAAKFEPMIYGQLLDDGPGSQLANQVFGNDVAAQNEFFWGDQSGLQRDLGIPAKMPPPGVVSPKEFEDHMKNMEDKMNGIGDDAQLANVDMQNQLQKQQQTLQMMSNISKMLHDTSMAIIRKIGG